jgi:hypothetical protein
LIVDDDRDLRDSLVDSLTIEGHEVYSASNGREYSRLCLLLLTFQYGLHRRRSFPDSSRESADKLVRRLLR